MDHRYTLVYNCKLDCDFSHGIRLEHHMYQGMDPYIFDWYMLRSSYSRSWLHILVYTLAGFQCIPEYMNIPLDHYIHDIDCLVHMVMDCRGVIQPVL